MVISTVDELLSSIDLEQVDNHIFKGHSHDVGVSHVFGGQVLSQALHASLITVPDDRVVHSMHGYFILRGDPNHPIVYMVEPVRDGGSFSTRRVRAIQHGRDIFIMALSFQLVQEGLDHQVQAPSVEAPEGLRSDQELLEMYASQLPESMQRYRRPRPIEFRPVNPLSFVMPVKQKPLRYVWLRANGRLPNDLRVQQRVLAYASDYNLLTTAVQPHRHQVQQHELQMASLDHAMWFHRPFDFNEWLLYEVDSPSASNARGFTRGSLYTREGVLVASVVQEGMIRRKRF